MKSKKSVRLFAVLLAILTLLSIFTACDAAGNGGDVTEKPALSGGTDENGSVQLPSLWPTALYTEANTFGEGAKTFELEVIADGYSVTFTVKSDEEFLGKSLLDNGLIAGDAGPYGLYITAVNGIVADYDANQSWWSVSKNGESLMTGVDSTPIENGAHYELTYKIG